MRAKSIKDFPSYSTIWTLENMNVLWSMQHFLTEQYSATQIDYKSSPVVYHRYSKLDSVSNLPCLPMDWVLKSSHVKRTRFTEKQRDYLSSKFCIGQTTGQKADAASVSKSMMTARDSNGQRLFTSAEFLTNQQVSSFFQDCPQSANLEMVK